MKARNSKLISNVLNILAMFYCFFSGSHPEQVLTNLIYLGTTKAARYLPQPQDRLSLSLCPGVSDKTFSIFSSPAVEFISLPLPAVPKQQPSSWQKTGKGSFKS